MFSFWSRKPKVSPSDEHPGQADQNAGWSDGAAASSSGNVSKAAFATVSTTSSATPASQQSDYSSTTSQKPSAVSSLQQRSEIQFSARGGSSSMSTFASSAVPSASTSSSPAQSAGTSAAASAVPAGQLDPRTATLDVLSTVELARLKEAGAPPMYLHMPRNLQDEVEALPEESRAMNWKDMFWFRDVPEWFERAALTGAVGCTYSVFKGLLDWKDAEIYMPPRSKVLPFQMRKGYVRTQKIKLTGAKIASQTVAMMLTGAAYFGGAFYAGRYQGEHTWENFGYSGALAGVGASLWVIRPWKLRTTVFGALLGGLGGAASAKFHSQLGFPFWDDPERDFRGYFLGKWIDLRKDRNEARKAAALQAAGGGISGSDGAADGASGEDSAVPVFGRRWLAGGESATPGAMVGGGSGGPPETAGSDGGSVMGRRWATG